VFVCQLGLLMGDQVRLGAVRILQEPHKGLRGRAEPATTGRRGPMVALSHVVTAGMVTYPGLPGPQITQHLTREASRRTPLRRPERDGREGPEQQGRRASAACRLQVLW
jgi:arylformamidase